MFVVGAAATVCPFCHMSFVVFLLLYHTVAGTVAALHHQTNHWRLQTKGDFRFFFFILSIHHSAAPLLGHLLLLFLLIIGFNEFHNCFAFGLLMMSSSSPSHRHHCLLLLLLLLLLPGSHHHFCSLVILSTWITWAGCARISLAGKYAA